MALYLYQQKWDMYTKDLLNMRSIGSMPAETCLHRAIGYLHALKDNKKIDSSEFNSLLHKFNIELKNTKQKKRKRLE